MPRPPPVTRTVRLARVDLGTGSFLVLIIKHLQFAHAGVCGIAFSGITDRQAVVAAGRCAGAEILIHTGARTGTRLTATTAAVEHSERTAEARLVLQHCLESVSVRSLVAIGSAFVYRLPPGNSNRLSEDSELDLDPDVPPEIRSWIDCDMILHGEVHNDRLRVVLLRVPTVVAAGGYVYLSPALAGRPGLRLRASRSSSWLTPNVPRAKVRRPRASVGTRLRLRSLRP